MFTPEHKHYYKNKFINALIKPINNKRLFNPLQLAIFTVKDYGLWPNNVVALDAFSQMGLQWTKVFSDEVDYLEMWDINPRAIEFARKSFASAECVCGDSLNAFKEKKFKRRDYNFILLDAPLPHQFNDGSFEHFGFFDYLFDFTAASAVLVFNVVPDTSRMLQRHPQPTEFVNFWHQKRSQFYEVNDGEKISPNAMLEAYKRKVIANGYVLEFGQYSARSALFGFITMVVRRGAKK